MCEWNKFYEEVNSTNRDLYGGRLNLENGMGECVEAGDCQDIEWREWNTMRGMESFEAISYSHIWGVVEDYILCCRWCLKTVGLESKEGQRLVSVVTGSKIVGQWYGRFGWQGCLEGDRVKDDAKTLQGCAEMVAWWWESPLEDWWHTRVCSYLLGFSWVL